METRGSLREEKQRVRAGDIGNLPESRALRRDLASASANDREVQDPQGPGG
ncbi:Hypothetical protein HVPorG_03970 [Roseomonas mucosa]|nr:Hypothetical protein HVPorG_03970 [Roseomonas mucosa]